MMPLVLSTRSEFDEVVETRRWSRLTGCVTRVTRGVAATGISFSPSLEVGSSTGCGDPTLASVISANEPASGDVGKVTVLCLTLGGIVRPQRRQQGRGVGVADTEPSLDCCFEGNRRGEKPVEAEGFRWSTKLVGRTIGAEGEGMSRPRCVGSEGGSKPQKPVLDVSISRRSTMLAVGVGNDETASDIANGTIFEGVVDTEMG
jgi:hypothetical protein